MALPAVVHVRPHGEQVNIFFDLVCVGDLVVRVARRDRPAAMREQIRFHDVIDHRAVFIEYEAGAGHVGNTAVPSPGSLW